MRAIKYLLVALVLALLFSVLSLFALASTPQGFAWLSEHGPAYVPGELTVSEPEGHLLGEIRAAQVDYALDGFSVQLRQLRLRINWLALLAAEVRLSNFQADEVHVALAPGPAEPDPALPEINLPIALRVVSARIDALHITGPGFDETAIDLRGGLSMRGRRLRIRTLSATSHAVTVQADGIVRFRGEWPLELNTQWQQGNAGGLSGSGTVTGTLQALDLRQVVKLPEVVSVTAMVRNVRTQPSLSASINWPEGRLPFSEATLRPVGKGQLELRADLVGDAVNLNAFTLTALGGTASGAGRFDLTSQALALTVQLQNLDLSALQPDLPTQVTGRGRVQAVLPSDVSVAIEQSSFQVAGVSLEASGALDVQGERVAADSLRVVAAGNAVEFSGRLWPVTEGQFNVNAPTLNTLDLAVSGAVTAVGRLQGAWPELGGTVVASATALQYDGYAVDTLQVTAGRNATGRINLQLQAAEARIADLPPMAVNVAASGVASELALELSASSAMGDLAVTATSQVNQQHIDVRTSAAQLATVDWGQWSLQQPFALRVSNLNTAAPLAATLTEHCWQGDAAAVCVDASSYTADALNAAAHVRDIDLQALLQTQLSGVQVTGAAALNVTVQGTPAAPVAMAEWVQQSTRLEWQDLGGASYTTTLDDVRAEISLRNNVASYAASVHGAEGIALTLAGTTGPLQGQATTLSAQLAAEVADMQTLAPLLERLVDVDATAGRMDAELTLGGSIGVPTVVGDARLSDARLHLPVAGIDLTDIVVNARGAGRRIVLDGTARSATGKIVADGEVSWANNAPLQATARITGEDFQVWRFPQQVVAASPDVQLRLEGDTLYASGKVAIPYADVTVETLPTSVAAVSKDVVVVRAEAPLSPAGSVLTVVSNLVLELGDNVSLRAFGLDTRLAGSLRFATTELNQRPIVEGNLRSADGSFEAYGRELSIERGTLIFTGALDNPNVDVRAVRSLRYDSQDIKIGVLLTGRLQSMQTRLFGEPAMSESDALSYLVLNRPMRRSDSIDSEALSGAAIALGMINMLPVTDQVRSSLGLDEIEFAGSTRESSSITAGKRIGDDLYLRYSYGLFERIGRFILRYDLGRGFSLEAGSGQEQTIEMLYSIDR